MRSGTTSTVISRQWETLKLIPRQPLKIDTKSLTHKLSAQGYEVSLRTIQRDLISLSALFPDLLNDGNRDVTGWFWKRDSAVHDFPTIDPPMALTFKLVEAYLSPLIPPSVLDQLKPYFTCSDSVLKQLDRPNYFDWQDKVRVLSRTQPLIPAEIEPSVLFVIYEALFKGVQFSGKYRKKNGDISEYQFHPLGLVYRESVVYLVATVFDYEDIRHYALHRFNSCELCSETASLNKDFNLDTYISSGTFGYADEEEKSIQVTLLFTKYTAQHLVETPLNPDQVINITENGKVEITATVLDTQQLRWWILGFGNQVEVISPPEIRAEFADIFNALNETYS